MAPSSAALEVGVCVAWAGRACSCRLDAAVHATLTCSVQAVGDSGGALPQTPGQTRRWSVGLEVTHLGLRSKPRFVPPRREQPPQPLSRVSSGTGEETSVTPPVCLACAATSMSAPRSAYLSGLQPLSSPPALRASRALPNRCKRVPEIPAMVGYHLVVLLHAAGPRRLEARWIDLTASLW
jgi:hypothetical protein